MIIKHFMRCKSFQPKQVWHYKSNSPHLKTCFLNRKLEPQSMRPCFMFLKVWKACWSLFCVCLQIPLWLEGCLPCATKIRHRSFPHCRFQQHHGIQPRINKPLTSNRWHSKFIFNCGPADGRQEGKMDERRDPLIKCKGALKKLYGARIVNVAMEWFCLKWMTKPIKETLAPTFSMPFVAW